MKKLLYTRKQHDYIVLEERHCSAEQINKLRDENNALREKLLTLEQMTEAIDELNSKLQERTAKLHYCQMLLRRVASLAAGISDKLPCKNIQEIKSYLNTNDNLYKEDTDNE